jgi:hypothetical protein
MVPPECFAPPLPMHPVRLPIFHQQGRGLIDQVGLAIVGKTIVFVGLEML